MRNPGEPRPFLVRQVDPKVAKRGRIWAVKQG